MEAVTGIFRSPADAELAVQRLRAMGIDGDHHLNILMPGATDQEIDQVPTSDSEQPGMGAALGGVVGGASGLALGPIVASLLIPGVGPVAAAGFLAMALFGAGGAVAGAAAGKAVEDTMSDGLPKDELFLYKDALRKGRIVVIALADDDQQAAAEREVLEESGAESIDAARQEWWIGLRDVEQEQYVADGKDFTVIEPTYRRGFEAALHTDGRSYDDASEELRSRWPNISEEESFRHGYDRGVEHYRSLHK